MRLSLPIIAMFLLTGCDGMPAPIAPPAKSIFARLLTVENGTLVSVGQVQLVERSGGLKLFLNLDKRPASLAGQVGMHIHGVGKCEMPDFASAGPHWNPRAKQHGLKNPMGHHAGDMANIDVLLGANTNELRDITDTSIDQLLDADGASIVIHEKADDYITDPSGNSGRRIICGVFEKP
jgi:superoxide dismutase, Cu-Zn family